MALPVYKFSKDEADMLLQTQCFHNGNIRRYLFMMSNRVDMLINNLHQILTDAHMHAPFSCCTIAAMCVTLYEAMLSVTASSKLWFALLTLSLDKNVDK